MYCPPPLIHIGMQLHENMLRMPSDRTDYMDMEFRRRGQ